MPLEGEYVPCRYELVADQVRLYEQTAGREGSHFDGYPCVILTTIGAKSGKLRKVALIRVEHDGAYAVVGSMGGQPMHPDWVHNVRAHSGVELQDGPTSHDMTAREILGEEKRLWWSRAREVFPTYDDYQAATEREIPVFVVEAGPH